VYVIQPILVFLVSPPTEGAGGYPIAADLIGLRGFAPLEALEFTGIGIATLVLVIAVHRLRERRGAGSSVAAAVGTVLGLIAGVGWIGSAAGTVATYGLFSTNLAAVTDDLVTQQAAIQVALVANGTLGLVIIGMAGWFAVLATSARRAGVVGWPLAVVALLAAAAIFVPSAAMLLPFGIVVLIPALITVGIAFLVKSRRAG